MGLQNALVLIVSLSAFTVAAIAMVHSLWCRFRCVELSVLADEIKTLLKRQDGVKVNPNAASSASRPLLPVPQLISGSISFPLGPENLSWNQLVWVCGLVDNRFEFDSVRDPLSITFHQCRSGAERKSRILVRRDWESLKTTPYRAQMLEWLVFRAETRPEIIRNV